ncbi:MAG: hypothetical protein KJ579_10820, partial [Verrucomicrobia bacterium]|nr:hypothetical protein [Verrucomicrobiota bacterium]
DEDTRNAASLHFGPALNNASIGPGKIALWRSGVPWDSYYLSDLDHPARPAYKVHYFAAAPTLSAAQAAYIRENLQKDGNVLVFTGAAGVASGDAGWLETLRTLSGMRIRCDPATTAVFRVRALPGGDRMAEGLKDNSPTELRQPMIHADDPAAAVFGEIAGTGKAGWAVRRFGTWTGIFIAVPGSLTPELVRNIVREAGLVPVGPCGDMTTAGNGFVTLHAMSDGEKTLHWAGPCDVDDLTTGASAGCGIDSLRFPMKAGETRWFRKR